MRSPFLSEREAFRFLLLVIVAMAAVVLAAVLGPTWLALGVLGLIVVVMAIRITQLRMRHSMEVPLKSAPPHVGSASERRVLVVANDTLGDQGLLGGIAMVASAPGTTVLILAPALVSPGDRVTGAVDVPLAEARTRLAGALERIANDLDVKGEVSEADPIEAIEDSFATFAADEVIVCTRPERTRNGLEPLLAGLARERFAVPVRHLVFEPGSNPQESDREAESKYRREASSRKDKQVMLETVAVVGILAALVLSMVALIRSNQPRAVAASGTASATSFLSNPVIAETSIVPEYKVGTRRQEARCLHQHQLRCQSRTAPGDPGRQHRRTAAQHHRTRSGREHHRDAWSSHLHRRRPEAGHLPVVLRLPVRQRRKWVGDEACRLHERLHHRQLAGLAGPPAASSNGTRPSGNLQEVV